MASHHTVTSVCDWNWCVLLYVFWRHIKHEPTATHNASAKCAFHSRWESSSTHPTPKSVKLRLLIPPGMDKKCGAGGAIESEDPSLAFPRLPHHPGRRFRNHYSESSLIERTRPSGSDSGNWAKEEINNHTEIMKQMTPLLLLLLADTTSSSGAILLLFTQQSRVFIEFASERSHREDV